MMQKFYKWILPIEFGVLDALRFFDIAGNKIYSGSLLWTVEHGYHKIGVNGTK